MSTPRREWAEVGLHDVIWDIAGGLLDDGVPKRVMDVGCGPAAFAERVMERGIYCAACDYQRHSEQDARCSRFYQVDLNHHSAADALIEDGRFGLVVAVEIIEHLENPWHFMRTLNRILEPGGYCILTTPNNQDEASRVDYLMAGELPWFAVAKIRCTVHITPIFLQMFYVMMQHAGFSLYKYSSFGVVTRPKMNWKGRMIRSMMRNNMMRGPALDGISHIWVLRKQDELSDDGMVKNHDEYLKKAIQYSRG